MSPKAGKPILWSLEAKRELQAIYHFIKNDSPQQAIRVKKRIIQEANSISVFPEEFEIDEFLRGFQKD